MGGFALTQEVTVRRRMTRPGGFGPVEDVGDPESLMVFGWYVTGGQEARPDGHIYAVEWDAVVLAPVAASLAPGDHVVLPGAGEYQVFGPPGQWDANPWWSPGLAQVRLKKVGA